MPKFYWEDFVPGNVTDYGPRRISRQEILAFAAEFDPQPMHLDEEAARSTMLGGLCASGWHSCALVMRMMADGFVLESSSMGAPGVEEVRWLRPIRPDCELTLRVTVIETRLSRSRPEMGLVRMSFELLDGEGEVATQMVSTLMLGRRPEGRDP